MKPTRLLALFLGLCACLSCPPARAQQRPVPPDSIPPPTYAPAGTVLRQNVVTFTPRAYGLLRSDYHWLQQDVATKQELLQAQAAAQRTSDSLLLLREAQLYAGRVRERELAEDNVRWMGRARLYQATGRPPLLLDRRLYGGLGLGLSLGAGAATYLLLFHR